MLRIVRTYCTPFWSTLGVLLLRLAVPGMDLLNVASENVAGTVICNTETASRYPVTAVIDHTEAGRCNCLRRVVQAAPKPVQALY